jgi:hypothetical protein
MIAALGDSELATLAAYLPRVVGGDGAAWRELATRLEPLLIERLRRIRTLGPMRHNVDDCRAVMHPTRSSASSALALHGRSRTVEWCPSPASHTVSASRKDPTT